jgi:3D (Asp-Asp-Asp) domain-containing protein
MSGYGITYSGLPALKDTVAVDPDVIPLGSVLKIPGI